MAPIKIPQFQKHLEDATLTSTAATYPAEIRENVIWLGGYLREKCQKNLDVLEETIRKLGFRTTGGTISKILIGRWSRDSKGNATPPIISVVNFNQLVEKLREHARISELAGKVPFVETETWEDFKAYVDVRRAPDQVCKFGLVIGPTGSQKTACAKNYTLLNNHGAVKHIEAPDTPTMCKFMTDLAGAYGASIHATNHTKLAKIHENVNETKTIIIDNIQRLYKESRGWNQPIFNFLQKLQDDTGCTIILMCVPEFELTLTTGREQGYFEQFEGRCGGQDEFLVLPDYTPASDLLKIAEAFGLEDAQKHLKLLDKIAHQRGRIRILFNVLQKAKRRAKAERADALTVDHIQAALEAKTLAKLTKEGE